jgi:hypothetical protein
LIRRPAKSHDLCEEPLNSADDRAGRPYQPA